MDSTFRDRTFHFGSLPLDLEADFPAIKKSAFEGVFQRYYE
jgi:hypothetical protein